MDILQNFINKQFYYLFVITLTFGIILYALIGFDYTDEICALFLFILFGYHFIKVAHWNISKPFLTTLAIFIFYLCYSFCIKSNVPAAILSDFVIQIKPYLAFWCVYSIAPKFSNNQKATLRLIVIFFWLLLVLLGFIELFYPGTIKLLMGHVAYYAAAMISLSLCYLYCTDFTLKNRLIFILLLAGGLFSSRAKFYGFFTLATFIILYFSNIKYLKFNLKTIVVLVCMMSIILYVAWDKIELYFISSMHPDSEEKDLVARSVLYLVSYEIFSDYFPFGSGFGSFGTYSSGVYYSDIYVKYGIENVWGINKKSYAFIADTYYPSLAQVGIVGLFLYVYFWLFLVTKAYKYFKYNPTEQHANFLIVILIAGFMAIEGTSDSTFTTHRGFFILMVLGIVFSSMKTKANKAIHKKQNKNEDTTN